MLYMISDAIDLKPKLLRFLGKPDDLSPKARIKMIFNHSPPFDRHDWIVDRGGKEIRYVIDYYHDESMIDKDMKPKHLQDTTSMQSIKVDVRPAIDSIEALFDRVFYMPMKIIKGEENDYAPPSFFPPSTMKTAEEKKEMTISKNWNDIKNKCAINKERLALCSTDEECNTATIALQHCIANVVCPQIATEFKESMINTTKNSNNDNKTDLAFNKMIQCIELFELDTKSISQSKAMK